MNSIRFKKQRITKISQYLIIGLIFIGVSQQLRAQTLVTIPTCSTCPTTPPAAAIEDCFAFKSTFKDISSHRDFSGGITTDGKVFLWGGDINVFFLSALSNTPAYAPLPVVDGVEELGSKIVIGASVAMVLSTTGRVYVRGKEYVPNNVSNSKNYGGFAVIGAWTEVKLASETGFLDIMTLNASSYVLGKTGKLYVSGAVILLSPASEMEVLSYTLCPAPAGVTYSKMWGSVQMSLGHPVMIFLKASDDNIYAYGKNSTGALGVGDILDVPFTGVPKKVQFPAGVAKNIVDINTDGFTALALAANGDAYGMGWWKYTGLTQYFFAATPLAADIVTVTTASAVVRPTKLNVPAGSTKFTMVMAAGMFTTLVVTDVMGYFKGVQRTVYKIGMDPVKLYGRGTAEYATGLIDGADPANYNATSSVLTKFKKIFMTASDTGSAPNSVMSVFALTPAGKAYVWGQNASGSLGLGPGTSAIIDRPVPIASGIGDPTNPNPVY
jgi:hypothetical protein